MFFHGQAWTAAQSTYSGMFIRLTNAPWNGEQTAGASLELGFTVAYQGTSLPKVISTNFNGQNLCLDKFDEPKYDNSAPTRLKFFEWY